ncbi:MAG: histidine triad nucleotide-binding protein [Dehalococcoidia bacterium]
MADCLFCNIIVGNIPADRLYEDDHVVIILDINPRAPRHFLVLPREHIPTAAHIRGEHGPIITRMFATASKVAKDEGIRESGYRIAFNVGDDAGMTVRHLHMHVLGGHKLGPEG